LWLEITFGNNELDLEGLGSKVCLNVMVVNLRLWELVILQVTERGQIVALALSGIASIRSLTQADLFVHLV
jgi:hypothetical protein